MMENVAYFELAVLERIAAITHLELYASWWSDEPSVAARPVAQKAHSIEKQPGRGIGDLPLPAT
jgi:hypothetical protein